MMNFDITPVHPQDLKDLQAISRQTFLETFSAHNSPENMHNYLEERLSLATLSRELAHPHSAFFFLKENERIAGYLKLNTGPAQTETQEETATEIERIYVLEQYQGKKMGQALLDKALQTALENQSPFIWLGVWEKNTKAMAFYSKNGFMPFDKHLFHLGQDVQTDILMKRSLK